MTPPPKARELASCIIAVVRKDAKSKRSTEWTLYGVESLLTQALQEAHDAARIYKEKWKGAEAELERLKAENQQLIDGIYATKAFEKLTAQNTKMRKALEEIGNDDDNCGDDCAVHMCEVARERLAEVDT